MNERRRRVAGLVLAVFAVSITATYAATPASRGGTLTVVNCDLQGRKGPLPVAQFQQLNSLLMYLRPDIIAIHNVLKEAGTRRDSPLPKAAFALQMYYAYQPLTDTLGSALLSRYPIRGGTCLYDEKTLASMGMHATVQVGSRIYNVLVVRPPTGAVNRSTMAALLQQAKALAGTDYLVLASFSPNTRATQTVAAWAKAGMFDPLARAKEATSATFPFGKAKERVDVVLLSPKLRTDYVKSEVLRTPQAAGLSEHHPVQVILQK